jgi:hypothetical protein
MRHMHPIQLCPTVPPAPSVHLCTGRSREGVVCRVTSSVSACGCVVL